MSLAKEIQSWPEHWATCPVYRKGYEIKNDDGSIDIADGKRPLNQSHRSTISPARTALRLEKYPEVFGAAGVFTGPRSRGLVILDVDANLGAIKEKYGADLTGPNVVSTKRNACKYLFTIPEELWHTVSDCSHAFTKQGFEILWGRMGVLAGAYPGKERVGAPEGVYTLTGDLQALPEAPAWLVALMQESQAEKDGRSSHLTGSKQVDLYRNWSWEQRYEICRACLSVIPPEGGGNDLWWQIGAMVHSAGLGDKGLQLWCDWSKRDPEYAQDWEHGNPCEVRWVNFNDRGGKTIRSLIALANEYDPEKRRFQGNDLERLVAETEAATVKIKQTYLTFEELYDRADEIFGNLKASVGERRYKLLSLANEAGIRQKGAQEVTEMWMAEREKRMTTNTERTARDRWLNPATASYYVPGILCSGVWLMSGRGGTGKTNAAWAFASHFLSGKALRSDEGNLTWEKGNVLWLTGDQPDPVTDDQIRNYLTLEQCDGLRVENNFNINDYPTFMLLAQQHKPKLVVIDSLRSTHRGTGVNENDSEFALPLRWYEQMMGQEGMFDPCMILVLHHSGHGRGGARGTSALGDMTSFTMDFDIPGEKSSLNPLNTRVATFKKHRFGLKDHQMLCNLQDDGTVRLKYIGCPETKTANTVQDRVRLKLFNSPHRAFTIAELEKDSVVSGTEGAIKKALQRLVRQGLAEKVGSTKEGRYSKACYRAAGIASSNWSRSSSQGGSLEESVGCPSVGQNPSAGTEESRDESLSPLDLVPPDGVGMTESDWTRWD